MKAAQVPTPGQREMAILQHVRRAGMRTFSTQLKIGDGVKRQEEKSRQEWDFDCRCTVSHFSSGTGFIARAALRKIGHRPLANAANDRPLQPYCVKKDITRDLCVRCAPVFLLLTEGRGRGSRGIRPCKRGCLLDRERLTSQSCTAGSD